RISLIRDEVRHLRARLALSAVQDGARDRDALLREAARDGDAVSRANEPAVAPLGQLVLAAVDHARGDDERAASRLRECIPAFERAEMGAYLAAARAALGSILGGDEGSALVADAAGALHAENVAD